MKQLYIAFLMLMIGTGVYVAQAQGDYTEQDAIDLAVSSPLFHDPLDGYPGWTAAAYDSGNAYGIWRVQFTSADGEDLGWADVSPERQRIYDWESHIGASDAQKNAAEPILRAFIQTQPDVTDLVDDPAQYTLYVDYSGWVKAWGIYLERGEDSLYMLVQFDGKTPDALDNPRLISVGFPEILSYGDWQDAKKAQAIATAFQDADIADALSGVEGWTTSAERQDGDLWRVVFLSGDKPLAEVTVDLASDQVVEHHVGE